VFGSGEKITPGSRHTRLQPDRSRPPWPIAHRAWARL